MPQTLFYVLQIVSLIILIGTTILFTLWAIGNFKNKVPFVTAPKSVLGEIEKALEIRENSVVYDLGCGDGRVLFHLSSTNPKAKYIGLENSIFPLLLIKLGLFFNAKKIKNKIEIIKNDFFKQDLSNATHIFVYLYPYVMDELLQKFEDEFKPGTRLVSLSFKFTNKIPLREIDLKRKKYKLGRKLYVYEF